MRRFVALAFVLATIAATTAGCGLLRSKKKSPDQTYGAVVAPQTSEDPDVLTILPPDPARPYFFTDAPVSEVIPRVETPPAGSDSARVEILVRGSFPDACYELSGVTQNRVLRLVDVTLQVRRPEGAFCATVVRPYRFYLPLDGRFARGPYTLSVNGTVAPFEVRF